MDDEKTFDQQRYEQEQAESLLPSAQDVSDGFSAAAAKPAMVDSLHPAIYVATWIGLSAGVIIFNKWILDAKDFRFPIFLTTWHLGFCAFATQVLARCTTLLDSRKTVPMTRRTYLRAILPIGFFFSLSLVFGNVAYLTLSVAFIQMLKATAPVAVLLSTWAFKLGEPNLRTFGNICIIVIGVVIASFGEIKLIWIGVFFQMGGIVFEATRLVMIQRLLSVDFKMDPLVSLYYFAPVCTITNGILTMIFEAPDMHIADFARVGYGILLINAASAFLLNFSSLLLIGKTSSLVLTLSGVLKNIMLVLASMVLFNDPVTGLQFFGFGIALIGLVYYQLGGSTGVAEYWKDAQSRFSGQVDEKSLEEGVEIHPLQSIGVGSADAGTEVKRA